MKRSGFTMIELIFVIVILGILAAVAIPRLAATRDDAKAVTRGQEITGFFREMGNYYTAHGTLAAKLSDISNVQAVASTTPLALNSTVTFKDSGNNNCVVVTIEKVTDGNISVAASAAGGSGECKGIKRMIGTSLNISGKELNTTKKYVVFGGDSNITY